MTHVLPPPPPEPAEISSLDVVAPKFRLAVLATCEDMHAASFDPIVRESLRTGARQSWLYGMGRDYDDGRGVVTNAPTGEHSWHFYGLAVDVTSALHGDNASGAFWFNLGKYAKKHGLSWGGAWTRFQDDQHIQWGPPMRQSPSKQALDLLAHGGYMAVWRAVGAV